MSNNNLSISLITDVELLAQRMIEDECEVAHANKLKEEGLPWNGDSSIGLEVKLLVLQIIEDEREAAHAAKLEEEAISPAEDISIWNLLASPIGELGTTIRLWKVGKQLQSAKSELADWDKKLSTR